MAQRFVSNKNESVRMFDSRVLEFFSHVHPATPLVIYVPVVLFLLDLGLRQRALGIGVVLGLFVVGLLLWTLVEYKMNRWAFNFEPKCRWGMQLRLCLTGLH